jgi:hypothetical protein
MDFKERPERQVAGGDLRLRIESIGAEKRMSYREFCLRNMARDEIAHHANGQVAVPTLLHHILSLFILVQGNVLVHAR